MIKQTATYGVWTVNRHEDNKIEVLKNGTPCEKAKPALREIAAEIGFEINPDWTSQQLGANVLKAMLVDSEPKPVKKDSTQSSETESSSEVQEEETNDFESMSLERIFKLCKDKNIECINWLANRSIADKEFKQKVLESFPTLDQQDIETILYNLGKEWRNNRNMSNLLVACVMTLPNISFEVLRNCGCLYLDRYLEADMKDIARMIQILQNECEKSRYSDRSNNSLLFYLYQLLILKAKIDIDWDAEAEAAANCATFLLHSGWIPFIDDFLGSYTEIYRTGLYMYATKKASILSYGSEWYKQAKKEIDAYYENTYKGSSELREKYDQLKQEYKKLESKYEELKKSKSSSSSSHSSSSSSSSRSSANDKVQVEIKYKSQIKGIGFALPKTKVVTMTNGEYRSLRDGSMKARIAYVNNKLGVMTLVETVSDVTVTLA